jgi:hypothetical protein
MWHRFFKLIYGVLFIGIIASMVAYSIVDSNKRSNTFTTYKVLCNNNQYAVYGDSSNVMPVTIMKVERYTESSWKKQFNFYCKNYEEIQNFITRYQNPNESYLAFNEYDSFKKMELQTISEYPQLFTLEKQYSKSFWDNVIIVPITDSLIYGLLIFTGLQVLKNFYTYIRFGTWTIHPFHSEKKKKTH